MDKTNVKLHTRTTKTGKVGIVSEHERTIKKKQENPFVDKKDIIAMFNFFHDVVRDIGEGAGESEEWAKAFSDDYDEEMKRFDFIKFYDLIKDLDIHDLKIEGHYRSIGGKRVWVESYEREGEPSKKEQVLSKVQKLIEETGFEKGRAEEEIENQFRKEQGRPSIQEEQESKEAKVQAKITTKEQRLKASLDEFQGLGMEDNLLINIIAPIVKLIIKGMANGKIEPKDVAKVILQVRNNKTVKEEKKKKLISKIEQLEKEVSGLKSLHDFMEDLDKTKVKLHARTYKTGKVGIVKEHERKGHFVIIKGKKTFIPYRSELDVLKRSKLSYRGTGVTLQIQKAGFDPNIWIEDPIEMFLKKEIPTSLIGIWEKKLNQLNIRYTKKREDYYFKSEIEKNEAERWLYSYRNIGIKKKIENITWKELEERYGKSHFIKDPKKIKIGDFIELYELIKDYTVDAVSSAMPGGGPLSPEVLSIMQELSLKSEAPTLVGPDGQRMGGTLETGDVPLIPIMSSNVKGGGTYKNELLVQFHQGPKSGGQRTYRYTLNSQAQAKEAFLSLVEATSAGRWVWENVRGKKSGPAYFPPSKPTPGGTSSSLVPYEVSGRSPTSIAAGWKKYDELSKELKKFKMSVKDPATSAEAFTIPEIKTYQRKETMKELRSLINQIMVKPP